MLENDWTLAHFLYYSVVIGCCLIIVDAIVHSALLFDHGSNIDQGIHEIPVFIEPQKETGWEKQQLGNMNVHISERLETKATFYSTDEDSETTVLYIYLLEMAWYAIIISVLLLFSMILKTVIKEVPFHQKNATYLFIIGWILLLAPFVMFVGQKLVNSYISNPSNSVAFKVTSLNFFDFNFIYAGIAMLVLGYVFKEGTRLHEEQKLTV